jgi:hypothetical protein
MTVFDYDLQTHDDNNQNKLTQAFYLLLNSIQTIYQLPTFLFLNLRIRHTRNIIDQYLEKND